MVGLRSVNNNALQQWQHLFESCNGNRSLLAQQHWQQLLSIGLPHYKHENWKHIPLDKLLNYHFVLPSVIKLTDELVSSIALPIYALRLVFVNGQFNQSFSDTNFDCFEMRIAKAAEYRNLPPPVQSELFLHLTESLSEQATIMRIACNQKTNLPIYLLHISSGRKEEALNTIHYRHHLHLETGAKVQIIEHYVSLNKYPHFTGARMTMTVDDNAQLMHTKLLFENSSSYHFAHNDIIAGYNTNISSHCFLLGANISRHNTSVQLNGENNNLSINSLAIPVKYEIYDSRTFLEHNKGNCQSYQLHKTIACDQAHSVFNGLIKVMQYAQKTNSKITNNNLLLGYLAESYSRPQLEIYADDVKCSHGVTIGQINKDQIFYLRTRGISKKEAQYIIVYAFAVELTEAINDRTLKVTVLQRIKQRISGGIQ